MKTGRATMEMKPAPPSSNVPITIPRQFILTGMLMRFLANFTVTGGTGAGTIPADALARYFRQIRIVLDGETIGTTRGQTLRRISRFFDPAALEQTPPASLAAGTNTAVEYSLLLPFSMPHSNFPDEFALPVPFVNLPQLVIDTAAAGDLVRNANGAIGLVNPRIEMTQLPMVLEKNQGGFTDAYSILGWQQYSVDVTLANPTMRVKLENLEPGHEVRAVIIEAEDNGSNGAGYIDSDTLVRSLRFSLNGTDVVEGTPWDVLRNLNKRTYGLAAREPGCVIIDAAEDRNTASGELFSVGDGVLPFLEMDVMPGAGASRVIVTVLLAHRT